MSISRSCPTSSLLRRNEEITLYLVPGFIPLAFQRRDFGRSEMAPLPGLEVAQQQATNPHPDNLDHRQTDSSAHFSDLPFSSLAHDQS